MNCFKALVTILLLQGIAEAKRGGAADSNDTSSRAVQLQTHGFFQTISLQEAANWSMQMADDSNSTKNFTQESVEMVVREDDMKEAEDRVPMEVDEKNPTQHLQESAGKTSQEKMLSRPATTIAQNIRFHSFVEEKSSKQVKRSTSIGRKTAASKEVVEENIMKVVQELFPEEKEEDLIKKGFWTIVEQLQPYMQELKQQLQPYMEGTQPYVEELKAYVEPMLPFTFEQLRAMVTPQKPEEKDRWERGSPVSENAEGAFGKIYFATKAKDDSDKRFAMKESLQTLAQMDIDTLRELCQEVFHQVKINDKHILKLYDTFRYQDHLYLILELADRDLYHDLHHGGSWAEDKARPLFIDMLNGLHAIHQCDISHRDIKLLNILITKEGHVKFADFGCSAAGESFTNQQCGTSYYWAPEMRVGATHTPSGATCLGPQADIWALGAAFFELLTGRDFEIEQGIANVTAKGFTDAAKKDLQQKGISEDLQQVLNCMLHYETKTTPNDDPAKPCTHRRDIPTLLQMNWFKKESQAVREQVAANASEPVDSNFIARVAATEAKFLTIVGR